MSFLATLIYAAYCANLISILLTLKVDRPFDSFHSLYSAINYKIGNLPGMAIEEYFKVDYTVLLLYPIYFIYFKIKC